MDYKMAKLEDVDLLVSQRLDFLGINKDSNDYNLIKRNCYSYFIDALNGEKLNVEGKNAYITSMYVNPSYRRKGIGTTILRCLIEKAKLRGYKIIMLNASDMGTPIYKKMGFIEINNGMILDISDR